MRYKPAFPILAFALVLATSAPRAAAPPGIHLPGEERPPVLDRIGAPEGLTAVTIAPGGERAAAVVSAGAESDKSTVLLYSAASTEPAAVKVSGIVRDLLFAPDSSSLLGLLHRPAKKREGDTHLLRIELEPPRARRLMRLPPSARGLDFWPERNSLLVACRNEVRTVTLPDLRSGPLYRVIGENLSIASLGAGLVLLGQEDALLLIDLEDPPGESEMPVRERVDASQPVLSLAAASDGSRALARLADGSVHAVELRPLRLAATGLPGTIAAPGKQLAPAPPPRAPGLPSAEAGRQDEAERAHPATHPTEPPPSAPAAAPETAGTQPAAEPEQAEATTAPLPAEAVIPDAAPEGARPRPTAEPEHAETTTKPAPAEAAGPSASSPVVEPRVSHQVRGRISGPAAPQVVAVVFLGPDNLLREALRVSPGADGSWTADGLAPGRYRVQLDGGGKRVIVSRPAFLFLELQEGQSVDAGEFQAVRVF